MITEVMTRTGKRFYVLSVADLNECVSSGKRLRAFCPIHGSDHQRSLSIDVGSGWGYCHCCHATILVEEYAPDVAETLQHATCRQTSAHVPPISALIHHTDTLPLRKTRTPAARPHWQEDEVAALGRAWPLMQEELTTFRAHAYFAERAIPPEIATAGGLGYLSRAAWDDAPLSAEQQELLTRWIGRIVFPLGSPAGRGYIGRTIVRWEPGMDEQAHKAILEAADIPRWLKTNPAGWYGLHPSHYAPTLILVEGGFDRLALLAAGIESQAVVALAGTTATVAWITRFAPQVRHIILALDSDESGKAAMMQLADEFHEAKLVVDRCSPPQGGWDKDWSQRWRQAGPSGIWPLMQMLARCQF
jgi:hypothetical protein